MDNGPSGRRRARINAATWFVALCMFVVVMTIVVLKSKHAARASFHSLGTLQITVDGWMMSHFMMYLLVGYTCYNVTWPFIVFGIGFEVIEEFVGILNKQANPKSTNDWFGRISDPLVNTAGLLIGQAIGKKYNRNNSDSKDTMTHFGESCLFVINFGMMWYTISEANTYFKLTHNISNGYVTGKRNIDTMLGDVIEHLDELSPI